MGFAVQKQKHLTIKEIALPVISFLVVLCVVWIALGNVSQGTNEQMLEAVRRAVTRTAVQCYALEGEYPVSLDYLEKNYGLHIDRSQYVVHYQSIGGNLMPQIAVFPIGVSPETKTE